MGTKKNLLEDLRKSNGCTLSQEQIAIRMGLPADTNGRRDYKVNRFETGETKSWDILNVFRYCYVTGLDPRLVFVTRYPEEPYSKLFLENKEKEQNMKDNQNTMILCEAGKDGGQPTLIPEILKEGQKTLTEEEKKELIKWIAEHSIDPKGELLKAIKDNAAALGYKIVEMNLLPFVNGSGKFRCPVPSMDKNTCVIGTSGTGKTSQFILPEMMAAMQDGKNIFAIMEKSESVELISKKAAETGHKVFVAEYPYNSINWFSSVHEPESIVMMANSLARLRDNEDSFFASAFVDEFECICKSYLWKDDVWHEEEKHLLTAVIEYVSNLSAEDLSRITNDKYSKKVLSLLASEMVAILRTISTNEDPDADKLQKIFHEKHVILYIADRMHYDINPTLALEQYLRILYNVKDYGKNHKDSRNYEVIIDNLPDTVSLDGEGFTRLLATAHSRNLTFLYSIASVEQLQDKYADKWKDILANTPSVYLTGFEKGIYSIETEKYLSERIGETTIETISNSSSTVNGSIPTETCKRRVLNPEEIRRVDPGCILHIEDGKDPHFIFCM